MVKFYGTVALEVEGSSPRLICYCWSSQFLTARDVLKKKDHNWHVELCLVSLYLQPLAQLYKPYYSLLEPLSVILEVFIEVVLGKMKLEL